MRSVQHGAFREGYQAGMKDCKNRTKEIEAQVVKMTTALQRIAVYTEVNENQFTEKARDAILTFSLVALGEREP